MLEVWSVYFGKEKKCGRKKIKYEKKDRQGATKIIIFF